MLNIDISFPCFICSKLQTILTQMECQFTIVMLEAFPCIERENKSFVPNALKF